MPMTYGISKEQGEEIAKLRKEIVDKRVDKRLHALQLRSEGMKNREIAAKLDTSPKVVSHWVSAFCKFGKGTLMGGKYGGNHRNMSLEEEEAFLSEYKKQAESGQMVEVSKIRQAYEETVGHRIGSGQIYRVLARNKWRKVMPRSKHPNKASEAQIEASKKLNIESTNQD